MRGWVMAPKAAVAVIAAVLLAHSLAVVAKGQIEGIYLIAHTQPDPRQAAAAQGSEAHRRAAALDAPAGRHPARRKVATPRFPTYTGAAQPCLDLADDGGVVDVVDAAAALAHAGPLHSGLDRIHLANVSFDGSRVMANPFTTVTVVAEVVAAQGERAFGSLSGPRTYLVVRVVTPEPPTPLAFTAAELRAKWFATEEGAVSFTTQMAGCSGGAAVVTPADGPGVVGGVLDLHVPFSFAGAHLADVRNALSDALAQHFGVVVAALPSIAHHVVFCLPTDVGGSWAAVGYVRHWSSMLNGEWCGTLTAQMHVIGRNFGLGSAAMGDDLYGDLTGVMGDLNLPEDPHRMCFGSAQTAHLGWHEARTHEIHFDPSFHTWTGTLVGIADVQAAAVGVVVSVAVREALGPQSHLVLGFNRRGGANGGTRAAVDQVTVTSTTVPGRNSYLEATLAAGESYSFFNPFLGRSGMRGTVRVQSIDLESTPATATVTVSTPCIAVPTTDCAHLKCCPGLECRPSKLGALRCVVPPPEAAAEAVESPQSAASPGGARPETRPHGPDQCIKRELDPCDVDAECCPATTGNRCLPSGDSAATKRCQRSETDSASDVEVDLAKGVVEGGAAGSAAADAAPAGGAASTVVVATAGVVVLAIAVTVIVTAWNRRRRPHELPEAPVPLAATIARKDGSKTSQV